MNDVPELLAEVDRLRHELGAAVATVAEQAQQITKREREHNADREERDELRAELVARNATFHALTAPNWTYESVADAKLAHEARAEVDQLRAERDRYRSAWQSARERAQTEPRETEYLTALAGWRTEERDELRAELAACPSRSAQVQQDDLQGDDTPDRNASETALAHTCTRRCDYDDYHQPHAWAEQPHLWCPGHSVEDDAADVPRRHG